MAKTTFRVEGLKELNRALGELPKATGRNVLRRVAVAALQPMADDAQARANAADMRHTGKLAESIEVSTQLAGYARRISRRGSSKSEVEAHMGPAGRGAKAPPQGRLQEFGTQHHGPQPFMRPAWDAHKGRLMGTVAKDLAVEIKKAAERQARKMARQSGRVP